MRASAAVPIVLAFAALLGSCSGGNATPPRVGPVPNPPPSATPTATATPGGPATGGPTGTARVTLSFSIAATSGSARRPRSYVSAKTRSVRIAVTSVNGSPPAQPLPATVADVGSGASNCTVAGGTITCVLTVALPVGAVGLNARTYPTTGAQGPPLSIGNVVVTVVANAAVDAPIVFLPVAAVALTSVSPATLPGGTPGTATLSVSAKDWAGDVIGGTDPYYLPITISTADTGGHVAATPSLPAKITAPGQTITFTYDGKSSANFFFYSVAIDGDAIVNPVAGVTGALALKQNSESLYVSSLDSNAVYVYAAGPTGANTLLRTIAGPATTLAKPIALAVDKNGAVYVVNYRRDVTVFAPGADGNVAPTFTFAGGSGHPESIELENGFDPVTTGPASLTDAYSGTIQFYHSIYDPAPQGGGFISSTNIPGVAGFSASPVNGQGCFVQDPLYSNSSTGCYDVPADGKAVYNPEYTSYGLKFRADGLLAVSRQPIYNYNYSSIVVYTVPANANGAGFQVTYDLFGPSTALSMPYQIAFDKAGNMYVANAGMASGDGRVTVFAPNATGDTAPLRVLGGFNTSTGVAIGP